MLTALFILSKSLSLLLLLFTIFVFPPKSGASGWWWDTKRRKEFWHQGSFKYVRLISLLSVESRKEPAVLVSVRWLTGSLGSQERWVSPSGSVRPPHTAAYPKPCSQQQCWTPALSALGSRPLCSVKFSTIKNTTSLSQVFRFICKTKIRNIVRLFSQQSLAGWTLGTVLFCSGCFWRSR